MIFFSLLNIVSQTRPSLLGSCNCDELKPIQCHLETKDLWEKFHDLGTEMIITKTGRWVIGFFNKFVSLFYASVFIFIFFFFFYVLNSRLIISLINFFSSFRIKI